MLFVVYFWATLCTGLQHSTPHSSALPSPPPISGRFLALDLLFLFFSLPSSLPFLLPLPPCPSSFLPALPPSPSCPSSLSPSPPLSPSLNLSAHPSFVLHSPIHFNPSVRPSWALPSHSFIQNSSIHPSIHPFIHPSISIHLSTRPSTPSYWSHSFSNGLPLIHQLRHPCSAQWILIWSVSHSSRYRPAVRTTV